MLGMYKNWKNKVLRVNITEKGLAPIEILHLHCRGILGKIQNIHDK